MTSKKEFSKFYTTTLDSPHLTELYQDLSCYMVGVADLTSDAFCAVFGKLQYKERLKAYLDATGDALVDFVKEWSYEYKTKHNKMLAEFFSRVSKEIRNQFSDSCDFVQDVFKQEKDIWNRHTRDSFFKLKPTEDPELPNGMLIRDDLVYGYLVLEKGRARTIAVGYCVRIILIIDTLWNLEESRQKMLIPTLKNFLSEFLYTTKEIYLEAASEFTRAFIISKFNDLMGRIRRHELKLIEDVLIAFDYMIPIEWTPKYKEKMIDRDYHDANYKQLVYVRRSFCCCFKILKKPKKNLRRLFTNPISSARMNTIGIMDESVKVDQTEKQKYESNIYKIFFAHFIKLEVDLDLVALQPPDLGIYKTKLKSNCWRVISSLGQNFADFRFMDTIICQDMPFALQMENHLFKCSIHDLHSACLEKEQFDIYIGNGDNIYSVDEDNHFMIDHKFLKTPQKVQFVEIDYLKRLIFVDGQKKLCIIVSKKNASEWAKYPESQVVRLDTLQVEAIKTSHLKFDSGYKKKRFFYLWSDKELRMIDLTSQPLTHIKRFDLSGILAPEIRVIDFVSHYSQKKFYVLTNEGTIHEISFKLEKVTEVRLASLNSSEQYNFLEKNHIESYLIIGSYVNHEQPTEIERDKNRIASSSYLSLVKTGAGKMEFLDKKMIVDSIIENDSLQTASFDTYLDKKCFYPLICGITTAEGYFFTFFIQKDKLVKSIIPKSLLGYGSTGGVMSWSTLPGMKFVIFTKKGFIIIVKRRVGERQF